MKAMQAASGAAAMAAQVAATKLRSSEPDGEAKSKLEPLGLKPGSSDVCGV